MRLLNISKFFPDFKDVEWKHYKLKEIIQYGNNESISKNEIVPGEYNLWGAGITPKGLHHKKNNDGYWSIVSYFGQVGFANFEKDFMAADGCFVIKPKYLEKLNNRFLFHIIKYNFFELNQLGRGTTVPIITKARFENFGVYLPDLEHPRSIELQRKIENKLTTIREQKENVRILLDDLARIYGSVASNIFNADGTEYRDIEWKEYNMKDLISYGKSKDLSKSKIQGGDYPVWSVSKTKPKGYHTEYINDGYYTIVAGTCCGGDVNRYNGKFWACNNFVIRPKEGINLTDDFLYNLLKWNEWYLKDKARGSTVARLVKFQLETHTVLLPDLDDDRTIEIQNSISSKLESINICIEQIKEMDIIGIIETLYQSALDAHLKIKGD